MKTGIHKIWSFGLMMCVLFFLSSCSEASTDLSENEYLIFGTFYGECIGETCVEIYRIEDEKLYEDKEDRYPDGGSQETGNYVELPDENYKEVKELFVSIPMKLWNTMDGTIGCPDCTDGGGVYVEIQMKGENKIWILDNFLTAIPEEYHEVVTTVYEAVESLN